MARTDIINGEVITPEMLNGIGQEINANTQAVGGKAAKEEVGNLSQLSTTAKGNLVEAINEVGLKVGKKASLSGSSSSADMQIVDDNGYVIAEFANGGFKTKNFDSAKSWLYGKNVAIIGDSISTNGDYGSGVLGNVPEIVIGAEDVGVELSAYITKNDVDANLTINGHTFTTDEIGVKVTFIPTSNDVGKIVGKPLTYNPNSRKVWWEVAQEVLGFSPIPVCWSGSSITSHENKGQYIASYSWHESQITKCGIRVKGSMQRIAPDVIVVYRGTNDFSHNPNTKLTSGLFDNYYQAFTYPTTDELGERNFGFKEGLLILVSKLRETYPHAKIILCTLNIFNRTTNGTYPPTNSNGETLPQYNQAIRDVADYCGCSLIEFDKSGITFNNAMNDYYADYSSTNGTFTHPNDNGHLLMGKRAIVDLLK